MYIIYFIYALTFSRVFCETQRLEDGSYLEDFIVVNKGQMGYPTILMYMEELTISECADTCRRHLSCVTFNYNWNTRICELVDQIFDELESDVDDPDWYNYGIPTKIDGGWAEWTTSYPCTATCGGGLMTQYRTCTDPEPKYGGSPCNGNEARTVSCLEKPCPIDGGLSDSVNDSKCSVTCRGVDGGLSDWVDDGECSVTCGGGTLSQIKTCTNPAPQHGGKQCTEKPKRWVECNTDKCRTCEKTVAGTCCLQSSKCTYSSASYGYVCRDSRYTRYCTPS